VHLGLVALVVSGMWVRGTHNLAQQRSIMGEYSNVALEQLLQWVEAETPRDAVFAGPMPLMANLMLSTRRPIVNHPHYEDAGLRYVKSRIFISETTTSILIPDSKFLGEV
jgi:C-mannosyltransferase DPY19L